MNTTRRLIESLLEGVTKKYSISNSWINDLRRAAPESGFPDIDPSNMTEDERDTLAAYLRADDGSLSEEDMEFSCEVADEVDALEPEEGNE